MDQAEEIRDARGKELYGSAPPPGCARPGSTHASSPVPQATSGTTPRTAARRSATCSRSQTCKFGSSTRRRRLSCVNRTQLGSSGERPRQRTWTWRLPRHPLPQPPLREKHAAPLTLAFSVVPRRGCAEQAGAGASRQPAAPSDAATSLGDRRRARAPRRRVSFPARARSAPLDADLCRHGLRLITARGFRRRGRGVQKAASLPQHMAFLRPTDLTKTRAGRPESR